MIFSFQLENFPSALNGRCLRDENNLNLFATLFIFGRLKRLITLMRRWGNFAFILAGLSLILTHIISISLSAIILFCSR